MKTCLNHFSSLLLFSVLTLSSCDNKSSDAGEILEAQTDQKMAACPTASEVIASWPEGPSVIAKEMMDKYGQPNRITPDELIWENNGKWKRTVVFKEATEHNFPVSHQEFLMQTIDYKLPIDKLDELVKFNGSIVANRTKGELSVYGREESSNVLAINIANEIAAGKRDVVNAREFYVKTLLDEVNKDKNPYLNRFLFSVPHGNSGDPDVSVDVEESEASKVNDL